MSNPWLWIALALGALLVVGVVVALRWVAGIFRVMQ